MSFKSFFCTCVLALILFACGNDRSDYDTVRPAPSSTDDPMQYELSATNQGSLESGDDADFDLQRAPDLPPGTDIEARRTDARPKRIIYTAAARARVEQLDSALVSLTRIINRGGGHVSSQHRTNSTYEKSAELVVRLPADQLDATLAFLPGIAAEIDYQNLDSRDVTAEWLDLESRLQTKRDVRDRYIDILRNRAQKVEDILNAEDKIRVITEEIESREGQLRYLRDQVALSTLKLSLYETVEYRSTGTTMTHGFFSQLGESLAFGWEMIQDIFLGLVALWPLLLIGSVVLFFIRRWWRNR